MGSCCSGRKNDDDNYICPSPSYVITVLDDMDFEEYFKREMIKQENNIPDIPCTTPLPCI
jgi:hypothetical protein